MHLSRFFLDLTSVFTLKYAKGTEQLFSKGIFVSSVEDICSAAMVSSIVFNKTGTLTDGRFVVADIISEKLSEDQMILLAAYAEHDSKHPVAAAIRNRYGSQIDSSLITRHVEREGLGCISELNGSIRVAVGSAELMEKLGVTGPILAVPMTSVYVAVGKTCVGRIDLADTVRNDAARSISDIKRFNVDNIALMTGDNTICATNFGREIGISEIYADYQPEDKLKRLQYIIGTLESDDRLAYVGDGIYDAPLLSAADLGIVLGSDNKEGICLPEILINSDELSKVAFIFDISKGISHSIKTLAFIWLILSSIIIVLSMCGVMFLWLSVIISFLFQFFALDDVKGLVKMISNK